jgi:hypothetical protein
MPLPLTFVNPAVGKKKLPVISEAPDEDIDMDDAESLAILRSESRAGTTARPRSAPPRSGIIPSAQVVSKNSFNANNSDDAYSPRFDEVVTSPTNTNTPDQRQSATVAKQKSLVERIEKSLGPSTSTILPVKPPSIEDVIVKASPVQKNIIVPSIINNGDVLLAKPSTVSHEALLPSDLNDIRQHQRDILEQMSSNQEDIRAIRQDLKQLQGVLASKSKGDELSKNSLQVLVDDMHSLSEEVRSSNVQYRESLSTLKTLAENERKALQSQISNERLLAATQRDSYEEKIAKLMQDKALFDIDKEKLDRGQRQLERSEALFEQRKIAAREEIETADTLMTAIRSAESRLNDEMERLNDLRNYVKEKDDEATMKLEQAHELSKKVREMEVTLEDTEYQRQELSKARMSLVQERVAMLKDRARERENERLSSSSSSIKDDLVLVRRRPTEFSADFPFVSSNARMALAMIKGDLKKLRKDQ